MYQTIIFIDLDGTLMLNPFETAVWPVIIGELVQKTGQPSSTIIQMIEDENAARQLDDSVSPIVAMDMDDVSNTVAKQLGVTLSANVIDLVLANAASHSSVIDYAHEALQELTAPHRALIVATKGLARYQLPVLHALGLAKHFTAILTPDTHSGLKKHRHFFGDWADRGNLRIMVGDLYEDDVLYPGGHGFKTLWKPASSLIPASLRPYDPFSRGQYYPYLAHQTHSADAILLSLHELPAAVTYLEQHPT